MQIISENTLETKEKVNNLADNTQKRPKSEKIISVIMILAALVTIGGFTMKDFFIKIISYPSDPQSQYEIYLSSEYTKLNTYAETDITATLNFMPQSVSISAYLDSVKNGDTLELVQKNKTEWHKKVIFEEAGIYKIIATAILPNGDIIEDYIEIEVISSRLNMMNQTFVYK